MSKRTHLFHCAAVIFLLPGSCAPEREKASSRPEPPAAKLSPELAKIRSKVYQLSMNQQFEAAIQLYGVVNKMAESEGNHLLAIQALVNIASCYHSLSSYREAMQHYKLAISEARKSKSIEVETITAMNMASLLLEPRHEHRRGVSHAAGLEVPKQSLECRGDVGQRDLQVDAQLGYEIVRR